MAVWPEVHLLYIFRFGWLLNYNRCHRYSGKGHGIQLTIQHTLSGSTLQGIRTTSSQ